MTSAATPHRTGFCVDSVIVLSFRDMRQLGVETHSLARSRSDCPPDGEADCTRHCTDSYCQEVQLRNHERNRQQTQSRKYWHAADRPANSERPWDFRMRSTK